MKYFLFIISFLLIASVSLADVLETKSKLADEYFSILSIEKMWNEMMVEAAARFPEEQKKHFLKVTAEVDLSHIKNEAHKSLIKHLSVRELELFVEFIKKPEALSAMNKMKYYMNDLMPVIQMEIQKAMKANQIK